MNTTFRDEVKRSLDNYFPRCDINDGKALREELNSAVRYIARNMDADLRDLNWALRYAANTWAQLVYRSHYE